MMTKPTNTSAYEKSFYIIKRKDSDIYVTNRPNKHNEEVEYTTNKNASRKFEDDDLKIIEIDRSSHQAISVIKKYTVDTFESEVAFNGE